MPSNAPSIARPTPAGNLGVADGQKATDDLWSEALKSLQPDDQEKIRLQETDKLVVLSEVLAGAIEKRDRCKDRQWKFKKSDGSEIILHDVFDKIVSWLNKLQSIGDFVAQLDPTHLALPWSVIKFFLQISTGDSKKFGAIYDGIEMITNLIGRYAIFEDLYLRETSKASEPLEKAIVKLYASVLTYLAGAKRYFAQNTAKRMVKSALQISDVDIDKLGDDIKTHQVSVDELARLIDAEYLRNACKGTKLFSIEVRKHNEALRTALSELNVSHIDNQLSNLTKELENTKKLKLLEWISKIPYFKHHENVREDRLEGSGLWLLEQPEYVQWRKPGCSSLLWLHGIPGSGKSKLMSLIIDTLRENQINPQTEPLAYFYCARNATELERGEPLAIVHSILRQLSCPKPSMDVQDVVLKKHQELLEEEFEPRSLTLAESKTLILELLEHNKATIIVDALDECIPARRFQLLATLVELVENSNSPVKVVVSSRDYEDISSSLDKLSNFKIDASNNKTDIERFVRLEVARSVQESRLLGGRASVSLQDELIKTLINGSQGMFLWVALQLQNLQRMMFEKDVLEELHKLPQELEDIYSTIYKDIRSTGNTARKIAETALQWLLCAQGRLSANDFIKAVSFDGTGQVLEVSTSTLLEICGNLVVLDTQLDVFRFTHLSVREFLEAQPGFAPKLTHATAAEICLNTLLTRDWLSSEITWQKATLYQYATLYWASHIEHCGQEYHKNKIGDALRGMFTRDNRVKPWFAKWLLQVEAASQTLGWDDPLKDKIEQSLSRPETYLFTACAFGFLEVVDNICKASPSTVRRLNAKGATGLHLASQYGHLDLVRVLLDAGVEIDVKDESLETALSRACSAGYEEIVQLLIHRGADRNTQGKKYGTPLQAASLHGHKRVVEILVEGADLDAEGGSFGTALQAASLRGHHSVVAVLLDKGAKVNALGGEYTKTIELAPSSRNSSTAIRVVEFLLKQQSLLQGGHSRHYSPPMYHETIVQLLLDQRMDINIQGAGFGPALHAACRGGHDRVARMLLDAGADSNAEGGAYGTALQAAAINGSDEVVQLLLEAGADVNNQSRMYNTALQAACRHQREKVILTLLSNKADINAQGGIYGSALQAAARTGSTKIVRLLLDAQADVNSQGGEYCTALQAASAEGFKQIVEMLLKKGADVNAQGGKYSTAILAASGAGHVEVVQLLVENGAKFGTALQIACIGGYSDIVAYLLEKGADPNADGGCFGTPLQTATAAGQEKLVQLLLDKKADANSNGKYFGTALQLAAAEGNKKLVRLLLDKGADPLLIGGTIGNTTSKQLEENASEVNTDKQSSALMSAVSAGHNEIVQIFLETLQKPKEELSRARLDQTLDESLEGASKNGHLKIVRLLLDNGAQANRSFVLDGALSSACENGRQDIVRLLLENGADVNKGGNHGIPPLHAATKGNHETIVQLLLENGADCRQDSSRGTVLHIASHGGFENLVRIFLDIGIDGGMVGECEVTPLLLASYGGYYPIVQLLLEHRADPNVISEGFSLMYSKSRKYLTALHAAAYRGHEDIVRLLLKHGAAIDTNPYCGGTALQVACSKGYEGIVEILLEAGADTNVKGGTFGTALQAAANSGSENVVRLLLNEGADVNIEAGKFGTALQAAASHGYEKLVQLIISSGADVRREGGEPEDSDDELEESNDHHVIAQLQPQGKRQKGKYGTSLQAAAMVGNVEVVRLLLDNGADVTVKDVHGQTPLHRAAYEGHSDVVELLLMKGADIDDKDKRGRTALQWVANYGYEKLFGLLTLRGAQIDVKDRSGQTAMHRAAYNGHISVVQTLIEKGLDIEAKDKMGETPLFSAVRNGQTTMIRLLLDSGAIVGQSSVDGYTALHIAASTNHHSVIRLLVNKGADIEARSGAMETPLHVAAENGWYEATYVLLTYCADIESQSPEGTALHIAAAQGSTTVLTLLLLKGANIHAKTHSGETVLHVAARRRQTKSMKFLLEKGANIHGRDNSGKTALHIAAENGYTECMELLLDERADLEAQDDRGQTPLHAATENSAIELLVDRGANMNTKSSSGLLPIEGRRTRQRMKRRQSGKSETNNGFLLQRPWLARLLGY